MEVIGFYPMLFLVVGLAVLFLRVEDSNAWLLALMFAGFIAEADMPDAVGVAPDVLTKFMYATQTLIKSLLPGLFYFFFAVFPTRSPIDRKLPWLKWAVAGRSASASDGAAFATETGGAAFHHGCAGQHTPSALSKTDLGYGAVILGMVVAAVERDRRAQRGRPPQAEGDALGNAGGRHAGHPDRRARTTWLTAACLSGWVSLKEYSCFCFRCRSLTLCVKHRVMDIPVLLRRSARYLLVERGFAILILLISVGITLWFGQAFSRRFSGGIEGGDSDRRDLRRAADHRRRRRCIAGCARGWTGHSSAAPMTRSRSWRIWRPTRLTVTDREALAAFAASTQIHDALHPHAAVHVPASRGKGNCTRYAGDPPAEAIDAVARRKRTEQLAGAASRWNSIPTALRGTQLEPLASECLVPIRGASRSARCKG